MFIPDPGFEIFFKSWNLDSKVKPTLQQLLAVSGASLNGSPVSFPVRKQEKYSEDTVIKEKLTKNVPNPIFEIREIHSGTRIRIHINCTWAKCFIYLIIFFWVRGGIFRRQIQR
jgi:hypothetical protein